MALTMKPLGNEDFLDEKGQLYITVPGVPDSFDPPGTVVAPVVKATGFTFDAVKTYGWPASIFWDNNPLQFASAATANKVEALFKSIMPALTIGQSLDEVKVGPYARAAIRQITVSDGDGLIVKKNAGEAANQFARYPQGWANQMWNTVANAKRQRDVEN